MLSTQPAYLARRTVGHACPLVAGQIKVSWTRTFVASFRWEEAEVTAASTVIPARMVDDCEENEVTFFSQQKQKTEVH